jgi:ribulose-phosphate 3-epimerase
LKQTVQFVTGAEEKRFVLKSVPKFCVDAACLPLGHFEASLRSLADAGAAEVFFVISDGGATPLTGVGPALVAAAGGMGLVRHVHLIAAHPERHVDTFAAMKCERLSFQVEGCAHAHRTLGEIRDAGMFSGIALSPCTPLTKLDYLLEIADGALLLGLEPGVTEGIARGALLERVKMLEENIRYRELQTLIAVGGGLDAPTMAKAIRLGAKAVVVDGNTGGWDGGANPGTALASLREAVTAAAKVV